MFQFSGFASPAFSREWYAFSVPGCPIRISADRRLFAPPHSFSQLITSFFASESLGIHRVPLFTFFSIQTIIYLYLPICQRTSLIAVAKPAGWQIYAKAIPADFNPPAFLLKTDHFTRYKSERLKSYIIFLKNFYAFVSF
jgi:hypothetical protein